MRRCPNCGSSVPHEQVDCPDCGYRGVPYPVMEPAGTVGGSPPLPPPPSIIAGRSAPAPAPSREYPYGTAPQGWPKAVAILGVVTGFFFLLTIPGWILLSYYRRWRRGEVSGTGLIVWGYISMILWPLMILGMISIASSPSGSVSP